MHNNINCSWVQDRPPMLDQEDYFSGVHVFFFPTIPDTKSNGEYLGGGIFEGPYTPTSVIIAAVEEAENILPVATHEEAVTIHNMTTENKLYFQAKKEAIFLILTGIGDEIYSTVDACNTAKAMWTDIERLQQGESLNLQDVKTNLPRSSMFKRRLIAADQASVFMAMTSVHISSGLVLHQMVSAENNTSGPVPQSDQASVFMAMTSVHISSGLVLHQMTSDHNRSELGIQDHSNEPSSSKLVPKVVPLAVKTATSRQELELLFHHHIAMLRTTGCKYAPALRVLKNQKALNRSRAKRSIITLSLGHIPFQTLVEHHQDSQAVIKRYLQFKREELIWTYTGLSKDKHRACRCSIELL
ncbi:hypothetical protein Tco_0009240 [Tanacetum coccineum]